MVTYAEITPSRRGLHIWARGILPPGRRRKGKIEMYDTGRYFTVTGWHLEGTPSTVEKREKELKRLHSRIFEENTPEAPGRQPRSLNVADSDLIQRAKVAGNGDKFSTLWSGDWTGYSSQSEADLALCSMLAFWTGRDLGRMDRLFRQSGSMRGKWDERRGEKTYGEMTVARAVEQTKEIFSPAFSPPRAPHVAPAAAGVFELGINLTDLGNARRFVAAHGPDLRFCYPWRKWLAWDGARWQIDTYGEVERRAKDTVRLIYMEAAKSSDSGHRKELVKHGFRSEGEARIKAMIDLARSEHGIPIQPEEMDHDPWILNVLNGTINLKTGELRPHSREDKITKIAPIEYRPEALCNFWLEHLARIFSGDEEMLSFLQLGFGYSLTGLTDERAIFIAHGSGANGKTTTHEVVAQILGDYAARTPTESILLKREGSIPNDLARLRGARFVFCSEADEGKRLAESVIKDLAGGDTITARFMRGEWFEFKPTFKIWLATNHRPVIRGTDNAIWDRIRLIPFTVSIPPEERIPRSRFMEKIAPELPGILAWLVQGARDWARFGLGTPQGVRKATEGYREDMDILGGFLSECCIVSKNSQAPAKDLYNAYLKWSDANGGRSISQTRFGTSLSERGFSKQRGNGGRIIWIGIGLLVNS